ncbi:MAG: C-terminal binding protein, partial [Planctomycetes bacterium]|nr:C-terminal binding protein [Planctomycetota bacterium]
MTNTKVVVTDFIEPDLVWEEEQCRAMGIEFEAYQLKTGSTEQLNQAAADADIIVVNMAKIDAQVIDSLNHCRLIIRHGIGYDNVDIQAASRRGIQVVNVPDYCVQEVAEQAVTLMMACQRKLLQQHKLLHQSSQIGQWEFLSIHPVYRIAGKTIGIIGVGRIGSTVYRMLQGFGVHFLAADPYITEARKQALGIDIVPLSQVLGEADIITIHVPLLQGETYHMFDTPQFERMKPSAILVNTSRGGVVNLETLDQALRKDQIAMAGIDVYEQEPPPADFPLLNNPKAICT